MIKKVSYVSDNTNFKKNTLYIGAISSVAYRFLSMDGITLFLINDIDSRLDHWKFGNNCVVMFPKKTSVEDLYEKCKDYLKIQEEVVENTQKLMDAYLADSSLQAVLDNAADIIENPIMVIDNGYRVIGTVKRDFGYNYFLRRRIENVDAEAASMFIAYNLKRLFGMFSIEELVEKIKIG